MGARAMRVVGAVLCAAHVAMAQSGQETLNGLRFREPLPAAVPDAGAFTRADWGDFDGDRRPEALLVEGDRVLALFAPEMALALLPLPGAWSGACAVRDEAAAQHSIALAGPSGVELRTLEAVSDSFVGAAVLGGPWANATALAAEDLDGDGLAELLGLRADRGAVLVARRVAGAWTTVNEIVCAGLARDVLALQWDADAALELAVLTDLGLGVFDDDGAPLAQLFAALAPGAIARVRAGGAGTDRIAWVSCWAPPAVQWLRLISANGSEELLDLGDLGAYAARGEDFDGDGDSDLLIAPAHGEALLWLENLQPTGGHGGATFALTPISARVFAWQERGPEVAAPAEQAWPAVADFDGDGDLDFVIGAEAQREVLALLGDWVDESAQFALAQEAEYDVFAMQLELEFALPDELPFAPTHWRLDVWRAEDAHASLAPTAVFSVESPAPLGAGLVLPVPIDESTPNFDAVRRARLTPLQRDGAGALLASGCASLFAFAVDDDQATAIELEASVSAVLPVIGLGMPENLGMRPVVTRPRRVPAFSPGTRPQPVVSPAN